MKKSILGTTLVRKDDDNNNNDGTKSLEESHDRKRQRVFLH
jgi:hypothetical protein